MEIKKYKTYAKGINDFREKGYKILTFKEVIHERIKDKKLFDSWLDSYTGIAYKKGSTKFKLISRCKQLLEIDKDFNGTFLKIDYNKIKGIELDSKKGKYNELLTKKEVLNHPFWTALIGRPLLKKYVEIVFKERDKAMSVWLMNNTAQDQLRALFGSYLYDNSYANGYSNLSSYGSFLQVAPESASHKKIISSHKKYMLIINGEEVYSDSGFINSIIFKWEDEKGKRSQLSYDD